MHLTSGYELTTAITNLIICIVSLIIFFKLKKEKLWKLFYLLMSIDSFLGAIAHGIQMSIQENVTIWLIMITLFVITMNTLFVIFSKAKTKYIIILSSLVIALLIVQIFLSMNFILTFTLYVLLMILLIVYYILKTKYKNKNYFLIGIVILIIGGIFMLCKIPISILDHNGICHIFLTITLILFYKGITIKK